MQTSPQIQEVQEIGDDMRTVELKIVVQDEGESEMALNELSTFAENSAGVVITLGERESSRREKQLAKKIRG